MTLKPSDIKQTPNTASWRADFTRCLRGGNRLPLWLALLALLPLSLLVYGVQVTHAQANVVFLAGIAAAVAFIGLALGGARSGQRAEQIQAQTQERFRVLFEQSSDANLIFDESGILDCNRAAVQMLGCRDKAEVLALHPAVLSPEFQEDGRRSLEKCVEMDALARERGYHRFEWLHQKTDGEVFPVEVTLTPVVLDGKNTLLVVWHDLTERKQMEMALRKSQEKLMLAQQVAHMGSWEYDLVTGKVTWSPEMFRLLDFDPKQGVPDYPTNLSLFHPADAALLDAHVQRAIKEGADYQFDMRRTTASGQTMRWFHAVGKVARDGNGQVTQLVGTLADITERKTIEETARQSQESLNYAQSLAHVGSWERDYRKGTMTWSDELFRLCGLEPGAITPTNEALFCYLHPLDRPRALEHMKQAIREGTGVNFELRMIGADGALRHIHLRTKIFTDEAGVSSGSRGSLLDITERVKAQQEQTKFVSLIENSSDFIAMTSLEGRMLTMNPAGRALVGLERTEDISASMLADFMPAEGWNWVQQDVLPLVMGDARWEGECQLVNRATGKVYDTQASFFLIRNPANGEPMCLATVQRDITEQKWMDTQLQQNFVLVQEQNVELEWQRQELEAANETLSALATTDGLTGAKNHRAFQEKLGEEFHRVERAYRPFSVILLDVDKFKSYNDTYGHPEGDRVLKQVVQVLQKTARESDFVARYGGEEFIVLLPETGREGAELAAERFRKALETQVWPLRPVTASFGVSSLRIDTQTAQQMIDTADKALYASKEAGRNRVTHADALPISSVRGD